ncbi:Na+/H+ antiporter subunit E [Prauserella muralis]|uniref:Sodium:proton antiporter n=1 Tax=Prauserella muralis TaxID=588067 RepID=A0A2V4AHG0_9PSEU|nr:Na+/H+ antiporter subunit E [Prauserella muralis]PXY19289.1 sodium:proton antiporter [Prauserella muralis]TWE29231.1 multisubunit sodium/proton antiporter MrpE subunit [Prauserella muralis]
MRSRFSLSVFAWLVLVWLLLWGSADPLALLGAVIVALAVLLLFPLPTRRLPLLRPLRLARLAGYVLVDLVTSAVRTSREVLQYGGKVRAAVVAVPVLSDVDHVIATSANLVSLTPDTFVLQIDRRGHVFYVYSLGVRTREEADRAHDQALELQVRVVRALGPAEEAADVHERAHARRKSGAASPERAPGR